MRPVAIAAAAVAALCLAVPALAQPGEAPSTENGRYSMTPTADGFLRLDTRTGAVSLCKVENGAARCQAAIEERNALQGEIDRLARQNEALKGGKPDASSNMPSQREFDRALDFAEQFMRRMMRIMRDDETSKDKT